jgi:hypothetical protein
MKIQKIALSILAIAISSSAFASAPSSDTQSISDQIKYAFLDGQPTYDIISSVGGANIYAGARGHNSLDIEFTSTKKEFITTEIVLPVRTAICAEAFKALKDENSEIEELNNYPAEVSSLYRKNLTALRATRVLTSCSIINPDTHKIEVLGLNDGEEKTSRALQPTLNFNITEDAVKAADEYSYKGVPISKEQFESGVAALLARLESGGNGDTDLVLRKLITPDQTGILESQEFMKERFRLLLNSKHKKTLRQFQNSMHCKKWR